MPPDWTSAYFEEKPTNLDEYYEARAEREDERWENYEEELEND